VFAELENLNQKLEEEAERRQQLEKQNAEMAKRLLALEKRLEIFQMELNARD